MRGQLPTLKHGNRICDDCGLLLDRLFEQIDSVHDMHA